MTASKNFSAPELAALDDAGYVIVEDVFDEHRVAAALAAIDDLTREARRDPLWRVGGTLHLDGVIERGEPFCAAWMEKRVSKAVAHMLGDGAELKRAHIRSPLPGEGAQALHADAPARPLDGSHAGATVILALTPFMSDNGATRVVPGSHVALKRHVPRDRDTPFPGEVIVEMPAGSALVFSAHLYHSGTRNRSNAPRHAMQVIFAKREARFYS